MYSVDDEYKSAVYAGSREVTGRVMFDISDVTAQDDVDTINATEQFALSNMFQLIDDVRENSSNVITWEKDRVKLDGSFSFAAPKLLDNKTVGFVSKVMSDVNGVFPSGQEIQLEIYFRSLHSSAGITVSFDPLTGECAKDFIVLAYNGGTEVKRVTIADNTEAIRVVEGQFQNYNRITVIVTKWSKPYRRARVAEIDFGVVKTYDDSKLIRFNFVEETDLTSGTLPITEFTFTVDNSDRAFNILNPTGVYAYLQKRQQVIGQLGVVVNGVPRFITLGNFLLSDWANDEGSMTATFKATTKVDLMDSVDYESLTVRNVKLSVMAMEILSKAGVYDYVLDPALDTIYTNSLVEKMSCREALKMVAIAGECTIYTNRDNKVVLKKFPTTLPASVDRIDFDNVYEEPKISLDKIVKSVEVLYYTDLETGTSVTVNNAGVDSGELLKLEGNTLINTSARAQAVANWILKQKSYRGTYEINWRGNPAHELADIVSIENGFGVDKDAILVRNELNYEGYLQGTTKAKGMV